MTGKGGLRGALLCEGLTAPGVLMIGREHSSVYYIFNSRQQEEPSFIAEQDAEERKRGWREKPVPKSGGRGGWELEVAA